MSQSYKKLLDDSYLSAANQDYIDELYEKYLDDKNSIPKEWQDFFVSISAGPEQSHKKIRESFKGYLPVKTRGQGNGLRAKIQDLTHSFRLYGHLHANLDPLGLKARKNIPDLDLAFHGLNNNLDAKVEMQTPLISGSATVKEIYDRLQKTYTGNIGIEYLHISSNEEVSYLQNQLETINGRHDFSLAEQKFILKQLVYAEGLEKYLGTKYVGQKRFSLEGGESLIPALNNLVNYAGSDDVKEIIVGMAHRGRLNVLVNILGKSPESLFQEFEGKNNQDITGDVKYHMGYSADVKVPSGQVVHLALAFNPSHLEIIGPVVEGSVRARQKRRDDIDKHDTVLPVLIHGDAAMAGQGVVMETMNFSQARGYRTGGTIHIIVNNQVGFTTSNPLDARSTLYSSDIAKIIQAPILHVNGDDPESVVYATRLAYEYRMKFKKDVVIDLVCYRKHGHNEADDPTITQPVMYQLIKNHKSILTQYSDVLIKAGVIDENWTKIESDNYRDALDKGDTIVETQVLEHFDDKALNWEPYLNTTWDEKVSTSITNEEFLDVSKKLLSIPEGFTIHPGVKKLLDDRKKMESGQTPINWGYAEMLAYGTLLAQGYGVRLSGQDSGRGTFSHRHAVYHDVKTGEEYMPLQCFSNRNIVIDSVLSEEAVLAFEYGFALAEPTGLVIWEAQFGDFANGAQVVIDQFISSGEQKWGRMCGLTLLLPHGFEGQGPEHSSARLERFLQLCAQENIQVCVPTTPSQIFHLLRRQLIRPYRKPLIVMSPKSLLRHKSAISSIDDLTNGEFNLIIDDNAVQKDQVEKVIYCSGKIYYELIAKRGDDKTAIVRIEQLYPFPKDAYLKIHNSFKNIKKVVWCQEEPKNQGAWSFIRDYLVDGLEAGQELTYVGREALAAPAEGSAKLHSKIQQAIIETALGN